MSKSELVPGDEQPMVVYISEDGKVTLNVRIENETAWLTQAAMADLFGCTIENIIQHLKNIYSEGELVENATTKDFLVVRNEGNRRVSRKIKHFSLDAIIAVLKNSRRSSGKRSTVPVLTSSRRIFANSRTMKMMMRTKRNECVKFKRIAAKYSRIARMKICC